MASPQENVERTSYLRMRKTIGYVAGIFPVTTIVASLVSKPTYLTLQTSFSDYYYTNFRDVFACSLSAIAFFLMSYKGFGGSKWWRFWSNDNFLSNVAGLAFLLTALCPVGHTHGTVKIYSIIPVDTDFLSNLHGIFAGIAFTCLVCISIFVFTKGQQKNEHIPVSFFNENYIYITCGIIMAISFIFIVPKLQHLHIEQGMLIGETIALIAFSISWLVKGRALGDKGAIGRVLYREDNR